MLRINTPKVTEYLSRSTYKLEAYIDIHPDSRKRNKPLVKVMGSTVADSYDSAQAHFRKELNASARGKHIQDFAIRVWVVTDEDFEKYLFSPDVESVWLI